MGRPFSLVAIFTVLTVSLAGCQGLDSGLGEAPDNHISTSASGLLVSQDGAATVETVVASAPAWICIQADDAGKPGVVLGCSRVSAGESRNVQVEVETAGLTPNVHLVMYEDAGAPGEFEIPEPDSPVLTALGRPVSSEQTLLGDPTWIGVQDQPLGAGNTVSVDRVYSPVPALLVIHDGRDARVLGYTPVDPGVSENVVVSLEVRGEIGAIFAELHWDTRGPGELNLSDPAAKLASGEYLMAHFQVTGAN